MGECPKEKEKAGCVYLQPWEVQTKKKVKKTLGSGRGRQENVKVIGKWEM